MIVGVLRTFLHGMAAGALGTLAVGSALLLALTGFGLISLPAAVPELVRWLDWAKANLGASIPVFAILLIAYTFSLWRLRIRLDRDAPSEKIIQLDHLTEIWTALFFGTGVIWTAIGMRSALLYALGDPETTVEQGAFMMLQRMVNGGILVALSTTIFGGAGGYLMRVYKALTLGSRLQHHYDRAARVDTSEMRDSLQRIERRLCGRGTEDGQESAGGHA